MCAPLGKVDDPRRHGSRMQHEPHCVDRRAKKLLCDIDIQLWQHSVRQHDVPMTVDREGRIRFMRLYDLLDRLPRSGKFLERSLLIGRCKSGRQEQEVALAKRHIEVFGKTDDHFPARLRAARFQIAQMPGGAVGYVGQVHLCQPAALPPLM
jgi:hypothetical protein